MTSSIRKVSFKPGLPVEVEVIPLATTIENFRDTITAPHRAAFYNVFWIQKGSAEYSVDFKPIRLKTNSMIFMNKDRVKALDRKNKHDGKILLFTDEFFARYGTDVKYLHSSILFNDLLGVAVIDVNGNNEIQEIFRLLEMELKKVNDDYHSGIVHGLLRSFLMLCERERKKKGFNEPAKGPDLDYTVLFRDLLETQFKTVKTVSNYASQINVSEKRLTAATSKTLDKSPKIIIDERVMLEAKRLLVHTNLSIKEVGYDLGFEDPTYFIKYFKKHTNKTPIEFRESFPSK